MLQSVLSDKREFELITILSIPIYIWEFNKLMLFYLEMRVKLMLKCALKDPNIQSLDHFFS